MFADDKPIESQKDDRLGRVSFSHNLAHSLINWKNPESLVVALCGKWGSGKSSVINLVKEEISSSKSVEKPTLIEFNPWLFSGEEKLNEHFFTEIAKELQIKNETERDHELANRLRLYSKLIGLLPDKGPLSEIIEKALIVAGLFGLSSTQILKLLNFDLHGWQVIIFLLGFFALVLSLFRGTIAKLADFFEERSKLHNKSVLAFKEDIKKALLNRSRKILIIIDDVDRLTPEEIRVLFKLIKINTDFPNLIYLLSFDPEVVKSALSLQSGVSGQDYLEKIVQVNFDIPFTKQDKIAQILFSELHRILSTLPDSAHKLFDMTYWGNVYHSGFKEFFKNIRNVKRFASSLDFNLSLLTREHVIEVNPIDFIAVEAIRVFCTDFYNFMRTHNYLFTSTSTERGSSGKSERRREIEQGLELVPESQRDYVKELISRIFPQLEGVFRSGYSSYASEWVAEWNRNLHICSSEFFDAYFTLIPGGDESEVSQFEMELILNVIGDQEQFERIILEFMSKGKIRKVLGRLQDYTSDESRIPKSAWSSVVQTLFNISDDLPSDRTGMFDFGADLECARIIYQLLKRNPDSLDNYRIFKEAIEKSSGLSGPVLNVSLESQRAEKEKSDSVVLPKDKLADLQKACLEKIIEHKTSGKLEKNSSLARILYRWREWSKEEDWKKYVEEITSSDAGFLNFLKSFGSEGRSHSLGDHVERREWRFDFKALGDFTSPDDVKSRLEKIRARKDTFYQENKELLDLILANFGKKDFPFDE